MAIFPALGYLAKVSPDLLEYVIGDNPLSSNMYDEYRENRILRKTHLLGIKSYDKDNYFVKVNRGLNILENYSQHMHNGENIFSFEAWDSDESIQQMSKLIENMNYPSLNKFNDMCKVTKGLVHDFPKFFDIQPQKNNFLMKESYSTTLYNRYQKGEPILLPASTMHQRPNGSYGSHSMDIIIWGNQVIMGNRGKWQDTTGSSAVYNLTRPLLESDIKSLTTKGILFDDYHEKLSWIIRKCPEPVFAIEGGKRQDKGNCTTSSLKNTMGAFFALEDLNANRTSVFQNVAKVDVNNMDLPG